MTHLVNDPKQFSADALAGFAAAYPCDVQQVHGGVVRAEVSPPGEVAIVAGGGSGHYPAFAGWVGTGMAHGAACGNIFSSPSASQIVSVARASDNGAGILFVFGNYAGDVLHFTEAADELRREGIDVRMVAVSDDIASNGPDRSRDRRGVAGDLVVVKIAGAAARQGLSLDAVESAAQRANERTRTIGVAFSGCTVPGAHRPQFTVPERSMAVGLGIHGEPGVSIELLPSANSVAELLVDRLLGEEPARSPQEYEGRVAVVLNGLGSTKYEELFVVYRHVASLLTERGLTIVQPEAGEHVTSLDMAGLSLTLTFLDAELESLWVAPADAPGFRRSSPRTAGVRRDVPKDNGAVRISPSTSVASRRAGVLVAGALQAMADAAVDAQAELAALDSIAGDGDHGRAIVLGTAAAANAARNACSAGAGARTVLQCAGEAWAECSGGASGALWGAALRAAGLCLSDTEDPTSADAITAVEAAADAVIDRGGAEVGDKTMVDALVPFVENLRANDTADLRAAWRASAAAAHDAALATAAIPARRGRARTHGDASIGHPDPGAISFALLMEAALRGLVSSPGEGGAL